MISQWCKDVLIKKTKKNIANLLFCRTHHLFLNFSHEILRLLGLRRHLPALNGGFGRRGLLGRCIGQGSMFLLRDLCWGIIDDLVVERNAKALLFAVVNAGHIADGTPFLQQSAIDPLLFYPQRWEHRQPHALVVVCALVCVNLEGHSMLFLVSRPLLHHPLKLREQSQQSPGTKHLPSHEGVEDDPFLLELRTVHFPNS